MSHFSPQQRYASTAEPELGIGTVTETPKGRVKIHFPLSGETRLYATETAPLRRVCFKVGDSIVDRDGRTLVVERVLEDDGFFQYFGQGRVLSEANLGNLSVKHSADDRLLMGDVDTPRNFALRRRTWQYDHDRRISPINGFLGGRIDLIPHQLYIAHEVSARFAPRVLLSDEVGLGKTIEACLIVHRLRLQGRIERVLILVPDSLVHQWFVEMLRRFHMWFHIFDEPRCRGAERGAPDGNPFLDDQLILCSTGFLANSPKRAQQAQAAGWDMLVVDEAHHLEWSVNHASREYAVVESLSHASAGLLLLTATPEQLGVESHFARLRLLDPERYADFEAFQKEASHHRETAEIVGKLAANVALGAAEATFLASLVGVERLQALDHADASARDLLVQDLLDQHGPGRVVFRNRRSSMTGFPRRVVRLAPIVVPSENHEPQAAGEESPIPPLASAVEIDPQLEWLIGLMQQLRPAKVLLICNSKQKVLALEEDLRTRVKFKVGVFHEDLTLVQRDRNAAYFSEPNGARLLLCSEIGSEGRNFQFAHHLILYDLPLHPDLLEQRIGRLDRIGQAKDIQIHVPYLVATAQEAIARWYHEGLNAFAQNLEGGNRMAEVFGERLHAVAVAMPSAAAEIALTALIAETQDLHGALKAALASGRDRLLEMNSFRPDIAQALIAQIRAEDKSPHLERHMMEVFEQYNLEVEDLAPQTYLLNVHPQNAGAFPAIPDEGIAVTFDRARALGREEMAYLTWDHPMVTGAIDLVLSSGIGSASFGVLRDAGSPAILMEVIFVLERAGIKQLGVDRFLPSTPIRVVVDHAGKDVTDQYPVHELDQQLRAGHIDDLLENETLVEMVIPKMLDVATKIAEERAELEISQGRQRMLGKMNQEIERLKMLQQKNNHIRPEEIELAMAARERLGDLIADAQLRLDAVQLIQCGVLRH